MVISQSEKPTGEHEVFQRIPMLRSLSVSVTPTDPSAHANLLVAEAYWFLVESRAEVAIDALTYAVKLFESIPELTAENQVRLWISRFWLVIAKLLVASRTRKGKDLHALLETELNQLGIADTLMFAFVSKSLFEWLRSSQAHKNPPTVALGLSDVLVKVQELQRSLQEG